MNLGIARFSTVCLCIIVLLTGCQPAGASSIPVTGAEISIPEEIGLSRDTALNHLASSSLKNIPNSLAWQLESGMYAGGEYHFVSGNRKLIILSAHGGSENQHIMLIDQVDKQYWCGIIKPDGSVVDTCLLR
jgi:hypothetical protein